MTALASYFTLPGESTHHLLGTIHLTVRTPRPSGPHPVVVLRYGERGSGFTDATTAALALTAAGFATVLFGSEPPAVEQEQERPADPLDDWYAVLPWVAGHPAVREDAVAAWGAGADAHDVRELLIAGAVRLAVPVTPSDRRGMLRRLVARARREDALAPQGHPEVLLPGQIALLREHLHP
ncbi:MAG: hypothetical protein J7518_08620 [Nocardioidaceae bacterium]|nr:hypothetical protein [Nocardioidaceae bacterium]